MAFLKNADGSLAICPARVATYYVTSQLAGPSLSTDKAMLSLLNPNGSGRLIKIWTLEYYPLSTLGTDTILDIQLRSITAHTGGSVIAPKKRDSTDADAVTEVRSGPTVTGGVASDIVSQHGLQANTVPASGYVWRFGETHTKPIMLAEGEGVVVHQVTLNGGRNAVGLLWTEE